MPTLTAEHVADLSATSLINLHAYVYDLERRYEEHYYDVVERELDGFRPETDPVWTGGNAPANVQQVRAIMVMLRHARHLVEWEIDWRSGEYGGEWPAWGPR